MNIFFVESPLQYLSAVEAQECFRLAPETCLLIINEGVSKHNLEQILNIVKPERWKAKHILSGPANRVTDLKKMAKLWPFVKAQGRIDRFFMGEYRSKLMRFAAHASQCDDIYLLDDGNASLLAYHYLKDRVFEQKATGFIRRHLDAINALIGVKDILRLTFFTAYKLEPFDFVSVKVNTYAHLASSLDSLEVSGEVYFLGQPFLEKNELDASYYYEYLALIKKHFQGKPVIYISHRREGKEKLQFIQDSLGFEIRQFNAPIELVFCRENQIPSVLASFFSSALTSCHSMFGSKLKITAFYIDPQHINSHYFPIRNFSDKRHVSNIYRYISKNVCDVIDLNEQIPHSSHHVSETQVS